MSFRAIKGKTKLQHYPKTASTTFTAGHVVDLASGQLTNCDSSSKEPLGVIQESVDSASSDYASTNKVAVRVPLEPTTEFEADVTNGLAKSNEGDHLEFSKTNGSSVVNANGTTTGSLLCVGYISTSKGRFRFARPDFKDAV